MRIEQFYDKGLAQGSYAIVSGGEMVVIDPARDPQRYFDFAGEHRAKITGVIETHPHADFVSSHLEIHQRTGAVIYASRLTGARFPFTPFDDGDNIRLGAVQLKAINTPGHSPDSICILLTDEEEELKAIFTGDTLFVGDVGRPDLRESAGNITAKKEELARAMYHSTREKLMVLPEHVKVYPAHGPGSLCGKSLSPELNSTIGKELRENYALQQMSEEEFVSTLLSDQPFMPKYFSYNVELNKKGASSFRESVLNVARINGDSTLETGTVVIDTRPQELFKEGHIAGSYNLQDGGKFETWLGSVVSPGEPFYLVAETEETLDKVIGKAAKIGYESQISGALSSPAGLSAKSQAFDVKAFERQRDEFTIVDIRNTAEIRSGEIFPGAIPIPLPELRERIAEIPNDKPVVVHCAGGYRSAAGASIISAALRNVPVMDMGEAVTGFYKP